jgi:acyl-coenzyme A thioesterase PaaI-like protein
MMAPSADPTFSGAPGEAVDVYISKCKFYWAGRGLQDDELSEARGTTLRGGLTSQAADYAAGLDINEQLDFDRLSASLKERFSFKKK